jgi:hypothetical protein
LTQRFIAEKYKIEDKTNFYLAKDGVIKSESNNQTLSEIIVKLNKLSFEKVNIVGENIGK